MPDMTPDREEALRRKLEDLEDAYGPAIRKARSTPGCTDIAVNEDGTVWATVNGVNSPLSASMSDHAARRIVNLVGDIDGRPIEKAALSASLPTGERFAALLPPTVRRIVFSIRLPPGKIYTLDEYVQAEMMTAAQAGMLRQGVNDRLNILVAGGTGAGKTTLGNALLAEPGFISSRTCIIQNQDELRCSGINVVRAFTGVMTERELVREFLRHSPDRIVIGEIREGDSAQEWIGANNTGHPGGLSTIHANSASHGLSRIARLIGQVAIHVPYADIIEAIDLIAFMRKEPNGKRRLVEIVRPVRWDGEKFVTEPMQGH